MTDTDWWTVELAAEFTTHLATLTPPVMWQELQRMATAGEWPTRAHQHAYDQWAPLVGPLLVDAIHTHLHIDLEGAGMADDPLLDRFTFGDAVQFQALVDQAHKAIAAGHTGLMDVAAAIGDSLMRADLVIAATQYALDHPEPTPDA